MKTQSIIFGTLGMNMAMADNSTCPNPDQVREAISKNQTISDEHLSYKLSCSPSNSQSLGENERIRFGGALINNQDRFDSEVQNCKFLITI